MIVKAYLVNNHETLHALLDTFSAKLSETHPGLYPRRGGMKIFKNNTLTGRSGIREVHNGAQRTRGKTHTL